MAIRHCTTVNSAVLPETEKKGYLALLWLVLLISLCFSAKKKKYLSGKTCLPDKHLDSVIFQCPSGLPRSPHGIPYLRTVDGWLDTGLCQYSIRGLMIVIATDSLPSLFCPLFRRWLCGKAASG